MPNGDIDICVELQNFDPPLVISCYNQVVASIYRGVFPVVKDIRGANYYVGVHLAQKDDRLICVGLDIRSLNLDDSMLTLPFALGNKSWGEVGTPALRGLALREVLEEAVVQYRASIRGADDAAHAALASRGLERNSEEAPRTRGRPPQLDDDSLRDVVASAYRGGGLRPVSAVQEALRTTGLIEAPTIDQARKAVARARARGFLAPSRPAMPRKPAERSEPAREARLLEHLETNANDDEEGDDR